MSHCRIKGCSNPAVAKELCTKHYMRVRRTGDAMGTHKPGPKPKPGGKADVMASLQVEIAQLKAENDELRRQQRHTAELRTRIVVLTRQVADLQRQLRRQAQGGPRAAAQRE